MLLRQLQRPRQLHMLRPVAWCWRSSCSRSLTCNRSLPCLQTRLAYTHIACVPPAYDIPCVNTPWLKAQGLPTKEPCFTHSACTPLACASPHMQQVVCSVQCMLAVPRDMLCSGNSIVLYCVMSMLLDCCWKTGVFGCLLLCNEVWPCSKPPLATLGHPCLTLPTVSLCQDQLQAAGLWS